MYGLGKDGSKEDQRSQEERYHIVNRCRLGRDICIICCNPDSTAAVTTKPWIGGKIDIKTSCRKQTAASPRSPDHKVRESILSTEVLVKHFMRTSGLSEDAKMLRESCYRFNEVRHPPQICLPET